MVMYLPEERPVLDLPYQMNHLANNYGYYPQGKTVFTFLTFGEVQIQFQGYFKRIMGFSKDLTFKKQASCWRTNVVNM